MGAEEPDRVVRKQLVRAHPLHPSLGSVWVRKNAAGLLEACIKGLQVRARRGMYVVGKYAHCTARILHCTGYLGECTRRKGRQVRARDPSRVERRDREGRGAVEMVAGVGRGVTVRNSEGAPRVGA